MHRRERIRSLLAGYRPDPTEHAVHTAMLDLVDLDHDPLDRSTFDPGHFTASGFVLSPGRDAILLIHHQKLQRWLQPGGHIDPEDPSAVAAAAREILEETGLDVALATDAVFDLDIHTYPAGREPQHLHHDVRFLFVADTLDVPGSDEIDDWRWVPFGEIARLDDDPSLVRPFARAAQWVGSGAA